MTWHLCYALGVVVTVCLLCSLIGLMARKVSGSGDIFTTVVGLTLTLPIVGVLIATALFWGTN